MTLNDINKKELSVIIPVYNSFHWLQRCLDSVCAQPIAEMEIICVDDASSDASSRILHARMEQDNRIQVVTLGNNRGEATARNIGMAAASGNYIGFVDSDDAVEPDFYALLLRQTAAGSPDIVKGSRMRIEENGTELFEELNGAIQKDILHFSWQFSTAIYKRDFLATHGITFPDGVINSADAAFLYKIISVAPRIKFENSACYLYFRREASMNPHTLSYEQAVSSLDGWSDVINYINNHCIERNMYIRIFSNIILLLFQNIYRVSNESRSQFFDDASQKYIQMYKLCRYPNEVNIQIKFIYDILCSKSREYFKKNIFNASTVQDVFLAVVRTIHYVKSGK
ncbi:glycosyltransferase family 2 protein [uncultured Desulfovibrio sp.]|uniref:glycosyltransferase family 2 protein n=1 Tax=uncultured Desulfovibrio sp. TaxID=167968 RepID=UPI002711E230|nr:glycosyltransferase family 2 protein [uncultured Desulfovibrio sp.]